MAEFVYQPLIEHTGDHPTEYRRLDAASKSVKTETLGDRTIVRVDPEALRLLAAEALDDVSHLLRSSHLAQLRKILDDPEASENDRFVALELLTNANIAAGRVLPSCQDTGTAIVVGYKGENVYTGTDDADALSHGIFDAYQTKNLRYSQM
ncbi:MAG: fumarate hydratase, partial [Myxococcales bacterium]|nr:fumarate hydratase [Myxococcales bacterium]